MKSSSGGFYSASDNVFDAGLVFLECSFKLSWSSKNTCQRLQFYFINQNVHFSDARVAGPTLQWCNTFARAHHHLQKADNRGGAQQQYSQKTKYQFFYCIPFLKSLLAPCNIGFGCKCKSFCLKSNSNQSQSLELLTCWLLSARCFQAWGLHGWSCICAKSGLSWEFEARIVWWGPRASRSTRCSWPVRTSSWKAGQRSYTEWW